MSHVLQMSQEVLIQFVFCVIGRVNEVNEVSY